MFCNHLDGEERKRERERQRQRERELVAILGLFPCVFPHRDMGCSAVCDFGNF